MRFVILCLVSALLVGCGHQVLRSPCPDFGRYCHQTDING